MRLHFCQIQPNCQISIPFRMSGQPWVEISPQDHICNCHDIAQVITAWDQLHSAEECQLTVTLLVSMPCRLARVREAGGSNIKTLRHKQTSGWGTRVWKVQLLCRQCSKSTLKAKQYMTFEYNCTIYFHNRQGLKAEYAGNFLSFV